MGEQQVAISGTLIISSLITLFGTSITALCGVIWWNFNRSVKKQDEEKLAEKEERKALALQMEHDRRELADQMKKDREDLARKVDGDKASFDDRVEKVAVLFGQQVKAIGGEFMGEIKEIKMEMTRISQSVANLSNSFTASEKRLDRHHEEIELLRSRSHSADNGLTELRLKVELNSQKLAMKEKAEQETLANIANTLAQLQGPKKKQA